MTKTWRLTRRKFLIGLGTLTGGVAVGLPLGLPYLRRQAFRFLSQGGPPSGNIDGEPQLWFEFTDQNLLNINVTKVEMGQGAHTALGQLAAEELEVPQIYEFNGLYYLVFCTVPFLLLKDFKEKFPEHDFYSADFSMVSSSPFGPFRMYGTGEIVPKSAPEIPYASQLIQWEGNWFLIGTVKWNDAKGESSRYICDPIPIYVDETGIHAVV